MFWLRVPGTVEFCVQSLGQAPVGGLVRATRSRFSTPLFRDTEISPLHALKRDLDEIFRYTENAEPA